MSEHIKDQIIRAIAQASVLYHRLVLLVAPSGTGKTGALQAVSIDARVPLINVNLEISGKMLDLTERQRVLQFPRLLQNIVGGVKSDTVLLDNTEILFDVTLRQDPLRLFQSLSRNKTIVAAWNGSIEKDHVTYALPDHPEYRRYSRRELMVVCPESAI